MTKVSFDALSRVIVNDIPGGTANDVYNAKNRLTSVAADASLAFAYDSLGRLGQTMARKRISG